MRVSRLLISVSICALSAAVAVLGRGCADSGNGTPAASATKPAAAAATTTTVDPEVAFHQTISPLLTKYCYDCHANGEHAGDVTLDKYKTVADIAGEAKTWNAVSHHVRTGMMPPAMVENKPTPAERRQIANWVDQTINHFDPAHADPGRPTLRRLNRAEYSNTIRDLVGVDYQASSDFPPDDSGNHGFDNIGDVLSLPPSLMEKYFAAADKILNQAIETDPVVSKTTRYPATLGETNHNSRGDRGDGWMELVSVDEDSVSMYATINNPGEYEFRVSAFAVPTGGLIAGTGGDMTLRMTPTGPIKPMKLTLMIDSITLLIVEPTTDEAHPGVYKVHTSLGVGKHRIQAAVRRDRQPSDTVAVANRFGPQQPGIVYVKWFELEGPMPVAVRRYTADQLEAPAEALLLDDGNLQLLKNSEAAKEIKVAKEGDYVIRIAAAGAYAGDEPTHMQVRLDGKPLQDFDIMGTGKMVIRGSMRPDNQFVRPFISEIKTHLTPGTKRLSMAFTNEFADPQNANANAKVRNLLINSLEVVSLGDRILPNPPPAPLTALFARRHVTVPATDNGGDMSPRPTTGTPVDAARGILADFGRLAWRRPLETAELDRLMKLYTLAQDQKATFAESIKLPMKAMLVSPEFLFIGTRSKPGATDVQPVDEFTLASRLSYFLWSSAPDEELLKLAEGGLLRANLEPQVKRMLKSPKSHALVENFGGQWLEVRGLTNFTPDKDVYPEFSPALMTAMQKETATFIDYIIKNDRSVTDFLNADYTFANDLLAKFYGLPEVKGEEFQKVSLVGTPRRGLLTQGSILILSSNPTRTSPVKRGKWVLDNLLGMSPPPPPPNVPALDDSHKQFTGTLRQRMEQHRADPTCASCHAMMDPIGFSLEHFDGIGAWRDKEGTAEIDPSGELIGGGKFSGAVELVDLLARERHENFLACISEKMLTYALGRGTEYYDRPTLDQMVDHLSSGGDSFSKLVLETVKSYPFQMCRPVLPPGTPVAAGPASAGGKNP